MDRIKLTEINVILWGKYKISFTPHRNVNIIVGINGSGKTTLLSEIEKSLPKGSCIYIPSIDNLATRDKRKKETALTGS